MYDFSVMSVEHFFQQCNGVNKLLFSDIITILPALVPYQHTEVVVYSANSL